MATLRRKLLRAVFQIEKFFKMACIILNTPNENDFTDKSERNSIDRESPTYSRIASSASVSSIASFPEYDLRPNLKVSDIKKRLSDLIQSRGPDLIQACKNFDRRATKKIPKAQFRQVLRTFCFPITAAQFDSLCNELQVNQSGKLNYVDFFTKLTNGKKIIVKGTPEKISDDLSIDEVELRIKSKIMPRLYDVVRAFWLFDINKDGLIQKAELRRIIRNYCFDLSDDLFDNLWKNYDPKHTGVIKYKDFLIKLGINADRYEKYMPSETVAQALCWSDEKSKAAMDDISCDRKSRRAALENKDDPAIQGLPIEEVLDVFMYRLQRRAKVLKNTFKLFDYEKNGQITLSDFHGILNFFVLPMSPNLFNRLSKRLEICSSPDCKLYYEDFMNKFCKHSTKTEAILKRDFKKLECHPVVQHIKNHVLNPCARLQSLFTKINPEKEWQMTRQELKKAIEMGFDFRLCDEEFKDLTSLLDPGNTNMINCMDFLQLFDEPADDEPVSRKEAIPLWEDDAEKEKYPDLCGGKLKSKMKHHINKNILNIERAILVCDPNQSGFILHERLLDILKTFCFSLSDDQFQELISHLRKYGNSLNYKEFMESFKKMPDEDANKWVSTVSKLVNYKSRCPPELPDDEVEELLCECVQARKTAILKDFKSLDACNVGVVCKDDVKHVLNKFSFRFNDKQFQELWKKFPVNVFDQLLYEQFLEEYSTTASPQNVKAGPKIAVGISDTGPIKVGIDGRKLASESCEKHEKAKPPRTIGKNDSRKSAKEMLFVKAPHLKPVFESMEPTIVRNFRTIRFHLQRSDTKASGIVDFLVLKKILIKSGVFLSNEDEFHLLEYFDPHLSGKINYREFLRLFVWYA